MTWIRVDQLMPSHPKVAQLAESLSVSRHEAIGLLIQVWTYASMYHISGDLSGTVKSHFDSYLGGFDSVRLTQALRACKLLNDDNTLHDWEHYAGIEIGRRERNAKYMQEYRLNKKDQRKPSHKPARNGLRKGATYVRTNERKERARDDADERRATALDGPRASVRRDAQPLPATKPIAETMADLKAQLKPPQPTNGTQPHA